MSTQNIYSVLKADAALNNLINGRLYRGRIPQNAQYPLIMYHISQAPQNTLNTVSSLKKYSFEVEIYAPTYILCESIQVQLSSALNAATDFKTVCESITDDNYQDELGNYSIFVDYSIWY